MWGVYLYLIRDVFFDSYVLLKDAVDWAFVHRGHADPDAIVRFLHTLLIYSVVGLLNGALLIGWAFYNQLRFRGRESRKAIAAVQVEDLGAFCGFPGEDVARWQSERSLVMIHDVGGKLLAVVPKPAAKSYLAVGD
jgi:poly-beta-1,6-N-acetyl-D-glucosamine biosynthesis protein PgaD